jgi:hypothetical protein
MTSSGVLGGAGSIQSQLSSNLGFFGQMQDLNSQVLTTQRTEASARVDAGYAQGNMYASEADARQWGVFANLGGTIFNATSDDHNGWKTIFGAVKRAS